MDPDFDYDFAVSQVGSFVDALFDFNVVLMQNSDPDIRVVSFRYESELGLFLERQLGAGFVQTIVNNLNPETKVGCPYFRVCMSGVNETASTNFKLKSFYNRIGMSTMDPRCNKAVIIGLSTLFSLESPISVPYSFCITRIDPIDLSFEPEIDMACMEVCAQGHHPAGSTLCDIAGLDLPVYLPPETHFNILKYLSSPCAELIKNAQADLCNTWDYYMLTMFQQREPRIPVHIASSYNAATVQQTVADAAKPYLVPTVPGSTTANHRRTSL